jgi:anti-sigma-K factor RskA
MSDNDPDDNDLDVLAGEYVLGVLSLDERHAVSARRMVEPELDAAILRWENRLDPLLDYIGAVPPPPDLWPRIMRELAESPVAHDLVANLRERARRWKITALAAGALAASLALGLGLSEMGRLATPQNFVAVLQKDAASPAFVVSVDLSTRELTIRPLDAVAPAGKSYELWIINEKLGPPKSLGVVEKADFTSNDKLRAYPPEVVKSSLYAITVEQAGGSPDGKPSGAPVFAGKLIRAVP